MTPIKGITVSVGYDDLLAITLPKNARHLTEIVVVTSPDDWRTREVVASVPSARCHVTDAFTRHGARFNKGAALEEGFDALGRDGWILVWDADILLPDRFAPNGLDPSKLYGAERRILPDPSAIPPTSEWKRFGGMKESGYPGYFQLFNASSDTISERPWYDTTFRHAGGGDDAFQRRWPSERKSKLNLTCLHLGPVDTNWFGRVSPRLDGGKTDPFGEVKEEMENLLRFKGWGGRPKTVETLDEHITPPIN